LGTPSGPAGFGYSLVNNVAGSSIDLVVTATGLAGDYNHNGIVDAADYVVWRSNPSAFGGDPAGYNTWRSHFGNSLSGSGSALGTTAVPEPTSMLLLAFILPSFVSFQSRRRLGRIRS
jgi:hypothetical protein